MRIKALIPILCMACFISACSTAQSDTSKKSLQIKSVPQSPAQNENINKISVIPSYHGPKVKTTNVHGTTYSGMGTSIYSRIGSSGLSAEGQSGEVQAMLNNQGIQGIKVLMLGDKIVIGAPQGEALAIDPLQSKLLSPFAGMSGTSNKHTVGSSAVRSDKDKNDHLQQVKHRVQALYGDQASVLTVTHPDALAAMDRAQSQGDISMASTNRAQSQDIALILQHASSK